MRLFRLALIGLLLLAVMSETAMISTWSRPWISAEGVPQEKQRSVVIDNETALAEKRTSALLIWVCVMGVIGIGVWDYVATRKKAA